MIKARSAIKNKRFNGFSLLEIIVSISLFSIILLAVFSFFSSMTSSNIKTTADREAVENAKRALEIITYEIRSAKDIYVPTTTANQLSLKTSKYLPPGERETFIDFFLCGTVICFRKEFQDPVAITSSSVLATNLAFSKVLTGGVPSVQVNLTVNYSGSGSEKSPSSVSLSSSASLRGY